MDLKSFNAFTIQTRRRATLVCTACLLLLGLGFPVAKDGQPARLLRLAVADATYAAPTLVPEAKGNFTQEGLALEIQHLRGTVRKQLPTNTATFNFLSQPSEAEVSDEDALNFLRVMSRAKRFIKAEPEQARTILGSAMKVSEEEIAASWKDLDFRLSLGPMVVSDMEAQERWARSSRLAPEDASAPQVLQRIRLGSLRRLDARAVRLFK